MKNSTYKNYVYECAYNNKDTIISNGNLDHAKILIATFFLFAKENMQIFSSELTAKIYDDDNLLKNAKYFFEKGNKLKILLQEIDKSNIESLQEHRFWTLCVGYESLCEINTVADKDKDINSHFIVMDEKGFRFCPEKKEPKAIASFNRPEIAKNLALQFNKLFQRSQSLLV